jgi:hypothetical protein
MLNEHNIKSINKNSEGEYNITSSIGSNGYKIFEVDWRDVPRYSSDGSLKSNEQFKEEIVKKHGIIYFEQNYGNNFIGSSHTLVSADILEQLEAKEPECILDNKLNVYHRPIRGHQYIMSIDPSKDGIDNFSVQVIDITNFGFKQVAAAKLQIDYLLMPAFISEWCEYYYNPYLIIENNEGAGQSIADQMFQTYEYENLHFDVKTETNSTNTVKSKKKYPGTRTTTKSRKQILATLKTFMENSNLEINDKDTIDEFFTFILLNNKYQADDSCHDDMIIALALAFTIFNSVKNFADMKDVSKMLFDNLEESVDVDITDILTIGSFDDGTEMNEDYHTKKENISYEEYYMDREEGFV